MGKIMKNGVEYSAGGIVNNITGSGTSGKLAIFTGTNSINGGPTITISTSEPTSQDGNDGDIWLVYSL